MKKIILLILFTSILISGSAMAIPPIPEIPPFPTIISNGNTYHVDGDTGSNANDGSSENPWTSIQYGVDQLTAGDTLIVHEFSAGYYGWISISSAGNSNNWITIKGADGENVFIHCCRVTFESSAQYILLKNIDIKGFPWDLVKLRDNSHHLAFDDIEIDCQSSTDNYTGVWTYQGVSNVWFRDMDIHHCGYGKTNPTDGGGVSLKDPSITDVTFLNVTVRDIKGDGIGGKPGSVFFDGCVSENNTGDGFDISASTRAVIKNTVSGNNGPDQGNGFKIWAKEAWLINSMTYNNKWTAVSYKPHWDDSNIYILNSTFVGDNKDHSAGQIRVPAYNASERRLFGTSSVYLYNNIFYPPVSPVKATRAVHLENQCRQTLAGEDNNYYFSDENVIAFQFSSPVISEIGYACNEPVRYFYFTEMGDGTWNGAEPCGLGVDCGGHNIGKVKNIDGLPDPGFVDLDNKDFHLTNDSLAIDGGRADLGIEEDLDGKPVYNGIPDIGAYEACTDNDGDGHAVEGELCGPVDIDDNNPAIYRIEDLSAKVQNVKIKLQWTCAPVTGTYNIYRSTVQGGPYELIQENHQTDECNYFDHNVTAGVTYYYVVRWADANGHETADSNEASGTAH